MSRSRHLRDPRELTAVAHPVRLGILEQLSLTGPLTATELADRLGESPANCSWHLRKLAEHRFVEEEPGASGRRRPWRMTGIGMSWGDEEDPTPEQRRAGNALGAMLLERWVDRHRAGVAADAGAPEEWRRARSANQTMAWLTAEETERLHADLLKVLLRHQDRIEDPALRPPGARLVEVVTFGGPLADQPEPSEPSGSDEPSEPSEPDDRPRQSEQDGDPR